jgi:tetratricopeptide (TPR) repeat protein
MAASGCDAIQGLVYCRREEMRRGILVGHADRQRRGIVHRLRRATVRVAGLIVIGMLSVAAAAQTLPAPERSQLEARQAQLFQQMLTNPADLNVTLAYAEVSARLGDDEAAVTALERLLLFNPNLPRINLELGALYFRMGSFEIAGIYFDKALAANPPPDIKARVEQYLAQIAARTAPEQFHGIATFGAQYQTDANVAPGAGMISSPIGPVLLNSQFVKHGDWDIFASEHSLYSYDLGDQNRNTFELSSTGLVNHYMQFLRLDLDLLELTAGPRFNFPEPIAGVSTASIKPYLIANEIGLGYNQYFDTLGGGIEGTARLPDDIALRTAFEFRQKNFSNASDRPFSTGLNGNDKVVTLAAKKALTATSELNLEFDYLDQETAFPYYANQAYAFSGNYHIRYDDPTKLLHFPWETAVYLGYVNDHYDAPDPCCNTSGNPLVVGLSRRLDNRWQFGISQTFQVSHSVAVLVQVERDIIGSNLPIYAYTSDSVLVGPQIRF